MTAPIFLDHLYIGVLAAIGVFAVLRGQPKMKSEIVFDTPTRLGVYWSNGVLLTVAGAIAGGIWLWAGRSLADLGVAWPAGSVGPGLVVALLVVAAFFIDTWWEIRTPARRGEAVARWKRDTPFMPETSREFAHFLFLAVCAGVWEEVIFRGYLISYLAWFTGESFAGLAAAVCIPAVAFGVVHLYQGWKRVAKIVVLSIALGAIFVLTDSLLVPIVLHVLIDVFAGYLGLKVVQGEDAADR